MTVTTGFSPLTGLAEEQGDGEPSIDRPLLLAPLMRRRREHEAGIEQPVLAAALLGQR